MWWIRDFGRDLMDMMYLALTDTDQDPTKITDPTNLYTHMRRIRDLDEDLNTILCILIIPPPLF